MLDRDPNADQPPDPSLTRARPRSHKPKNAPKKQPQRGLGVAQLEKLRLEEQSKQQEAVCLASLQHQNFHHHGHFHQQEQYTPHFVHQHHLFQQQHLNQSSSLRLSRQIKLIEPTLDKSSFPLPFAKLNVAQNSLLPLTVMTSGRQTSSLPLLIPQQQVINEDEATLSPLSNMPDLCSPGYVRPSSAESHLCPLHVRTSPAARGENPWLSHLYDRDSTKEKDSTITFLSSASCSDSDTKLQSFDHGTTESTNATISSLHSGNGNLHNSMEKLYMQKEGTTTPFTELCLSGCPAGVFALQNLSRTCLEPPPESIASGGVQMRELSSFQTISLCPTWSPVDKVFNRKRSWACTQELARQSEVFKGVDLNVAIDEIEAEVTEQEPNLSLPFTIRDDFNLSSALSPKKSSQSTEKALLAGKACSECGSMKVDNTFPDMCVNGSAFLSLQKRNLDHEKWEVEASGDFLTLGPPCSSVQMIRNEHRGSGYTSICPLSRKPGENASSWPSKQGQAKCAHFSRAASNDERMGLLECKQNFCNATSRRNAELPDFFVLSKMEVYSSRLRENGTDESLDLELRLSI